ncbi:hypothetical protein [Paenibacillus sp. GCM10027626]|uniref:hypothetical protein n=1 Tax=Paenibacillus sp. GCM10027626 TaxID=3273411 RepID=UPI003627CC21
MRYTVESISEQIRSRVEEKFQILFSSIAEELAYDFLFSPKYIVTHDYDPPWDHSGMLLQINEKFSLEDYSCVEDFFEEYTGQSRASYMSGCGFFYDTFEEKYEEQIREFVYGCIVEVLAGIDDTTLIELLLEHGYEVSEAEKNDIIQTVTDYELFDEPFWYHYEILDRIKLCNFELMILRGRNEAMKRYETKRLKIKEARERTEARERIEAEKEVAQKLWNKLEKLYKLQMGGKQLLKVEMKDYETFVSFLDQNQVSREERIMLAKYMGDKLSNKVYVCLRR